MADEIEPQQESPLSPPPKLARLSSDDAAGVVTMASPSPLVLGLGLGLGVDLVPGKPAFTFMQMQELEHQALIYKYMVAGVPVPLHLVLPIWKSVAASPYGLHHYPSLMGYRHLCYDYRNSMEPEPGRCRRTDGKKWRCSRDVVPDQKYCERHMHRGRNRSRKPVEAGAAPGGGRGEIPTTAAAAGGGQVQPSSTNLSISIPTGGLQLMPAAANYSNNSSSSSNVSPPSLGFSPTSVLVACKTVPS